MAVSAPRGGAGTGAGVGDGARAGAGDGEILDLGVAMRSVNIRFASTGEMPDGTPVKFAFSDGHPVNFNVVRLSDGVLLDSFEMDPDSIGASLVQHPDGSVYFSVRGATNGRLSRYDPHAGTVEDIATGVVSETMLRTLAVDEETGVVYGCTYPNAKIFSYDPATGDIHDFGSMVSDGDRLWGFDVVEGKVWGGSGQERGRLIELDPQTGRSTEIALPETIGSDAVTIYAIYRRGHLVTVSANPSLEDTNTYIWDLEQGAWAHEGSLAGPMQNNGQSTRIDSTGSFYYFSGDELWAYDVQQNVSTATGFADSEIAEFAATRTVDLIEQDGRREVVGIHNEGTLWSYDLDARTGRTLEPEPMGAPATLHSIGVGPDGLVYTGAYLSSGVMARASTDTYEIEELPGPHQADCIIDARGSLVITEYPNAIAHRGEPDPWEWGTNPAHWFTVGRAEHQQDRIFTATPFLDQVAFGTVPDYAVLGGALVLADRDGSFEVHRNIVPDQSVATLTTQHRWLFGGTSIHGGIGATPTAQEAMLFIFDGRTKEKVFEVAPVPGEEIVHTLRVIGRSVWGMTRNGVIFEFDIASRSVLRQVETGYVDTNDWGRLGNIYWRSQDRQIYGNAGRTLFRLDPGTLEVTELAEGAKVSTLAPTGEIFFGDDTNLYVYQP